MLSEGKGEDSEDPDICAIIFPPGVCPEHESHARGRVSGQTHALALAAPHGMRRRKTTEDEFLALSGKRLGD